MLLNRVPLAGLLFAVAGCMTVKAVEPAKYIPQNNPAVVWVTRTDETVVPVAHPRIDGDSLKGTTQDLQEPVAIPLKEVQTVKAKMRSPQKTVILISSLGAISTAVVYAVLTAGNSGSNSGNPACLDAHGDPIGAC